MRIFFTPESKFLCILRILFLFQVVPDGEVVEVLVVAVVVADSVVVAVGAAVEVASSVLMVVDPVLMGPLMELGDPPTRRAAMEPVPPAMASTAAPRATDSGPRSQVQQADVYGTGVSGRSSTKSRMW